MTDRYTHARAYARSMARVSRSIERFAAACRSLPFAVAGDDVSATADWGNDEVSLPIVAADAETFSRPMREHKPASDECVIALIREELERQGLGWLDVALVDSRMGPGFTRIHIGGPRGWIEQNDEVRSSYASIVGPGWSQTIASAARSHLSSLPCGVCRGAWPMICPACGERNVGEVLR